MRFMKDFPATFHFKDLPIGRSWNKNSNTPVSSWRKWGWCSAGEVVEMVNEKYELNWSPAELLQAFPFVANSRVIRRTKILFASRNDSICLVDATDEIIHNLVTSRSEFFIPAGLTKAILADMEVNKARLTRVLKGQVVLFNAKNEPVCKF